MESFDRKMLHSLRTEIGGMATAALFKRWRPDLLHQTRRLQAQFLCPRHNWVSERILAGARKRDLRTLVWTVDDLDQANQLAEWGVDGIITNRTAEMVLWRNKARILPPIE